MLSYRANCPIQTQRTNLLRKETKNISLSVLTTNQKSFLVPENFTKRDDNPKSIDPMIFKQIKKPNQNTKIIENIKMKCLIQASIGSIDTNLSQKENNSLQNNTQSKFKQFISNAIDTIDHDSFNNDKINRFNHKSSLITYNRYQNKKKKIFDMLCPQKSLQYFGERSKGNKNQEINSNQNQFALNKNEPTDDLFKYKMKQNKIHKDNRYSVEKKQHKIIRNPSLTKLSQLKYQLEKLIINSSTQPKTLVYSKSKSTFRKKDLRSFGKIENETEIAEFKRDFNV